MQILYKIKNIACLLFFLFLVNYAKADKSLKILYVDANCSNRDLLFSKIDNIVKDQKFLIFISRQNRPIVYTNYSDFIACFETNGECRGNFPQETSYNDEYIYFFNALVKSNLQNDLAFFNLSNDNLITTSSNLEFFFFIDIEKCIVNESSALDLFVFNFYELLLDKKDSQVLAKVFFDKDKYKVVQEGKPSISQQLECFKSTTKILYETF